MSRPIILSALLCGLVFASACGSDSARPHVLLIVVDTLRSDRLGCYGAEAETSPAIDALARSGTRFANAYAPSPWTKPSVASILTGRYPSGHGLTGVSRKLPKGVRSIAQMLRAEGYATAGVVSNQLVFGLKRGFEHFDASEGKGPDHLSSPGVSEKAIALAEKLAANDRPFFLYVHYFDPHVNYIPHPELSMTPASAGRLDGTQGWREIERMRADLGPDEVRFLRALYDGEVRYTDESVGALLDALESLGIAERTIVVFTSDHGEEILEHGNIGHTRTLYEELIRVPLIVRAPGAEPGRVIEDPVSLVSLAPTILDLARIESSRSDRADRADSESFQGVSLAGRILGRDPEPPGQGAAPEAGAIFAEVDFVPLPNADVTVEVTRKKSLRRGRYKLIADELSGGFELYDLESDPGETFDLAPTKTAVVADLRRDLELAVEHAKRGTLASEHEDLDAEDIELLRELGYIE